MVKLWNCPSCTTAARTVDDATPLHRCQGLGLLVPLIPEGTKAKLTVIERQDYVGQEVVQLDQVHQRPVMSVVTMRDDGQDCTVYAPVATATQEEVYD